MTKTCLPLLALLALGAAPALIGAAIAQPASPHNGDPHASHMPSPGEMAAQHKQMCQDSYAHTVGDLAYEEARLTLTRAQQPLFDRWKSVKLDNARHDAADCATRELPRGKLPTPLDALTFEHDSLKQRLANMDAEIPALTAFYNSLTQAQKDALSHPGQQAMMMSHRRDFLPDMGPRMDHGGPGGPGGPGSPPPQ